MGARLTGLPTAAICCSLEFLSINQSNLYLVDTATGDKKQITPAQQPGSQVFYGPPSSAKTAKESISPPTATPTSSAWRTSTSPP